MKKYKNQTLRSFCFEKESFLIRLDMDEEGLSVLWSDLVTFSFETVNFFFLEEDEKP